MPAVNPRLWKLIVRYSRQYDLDPYAVAAVSIMEGGGRFGAVGDSGTSYGPFQLHVGGALPPGKTAAWANSASGVAYALRKMSQSGARGLRGPAAITSIVRNFERPAAPGPEIAGAVNHYTALRRMPLPRGGGYGVPAQRSIRQQYTPVPIKVTPPPLNFTAPTQAALAGLPGIQQRVPPLQVGSSLADQGTSLSGQLAEIRRKLLA